MIALCWKDGVNLFRGIWSSVVRLSAAKLTRLEIVIAILLTTTVLLNGFISVAPLTGSDPMQYHFVFPKIYAKSHSIHPILWDFNSFFLGHVGESGARGLTRADDRLSILRPDRYALGWGA